MVTRCTSWAYVAAVLLLTGVSTATAKYSGGTGEPNDPYQIATAADLIALGETPEDYEKHFILTGDIDLDPNLPGGKVFDRAVIAPDTDPNDRDSLFQGTLFTGVFDGAGHTISNLTISGKDHLGLFGQLRSWDAPACEVKDLGLVHVNISGTGSAVGGLVGENWGIITSSYTSGSVSGVSGVGGLAGYNSGSITASYSTGSVGGDRFVGGLAGSNGGTITASYSTGSVSGGRYVGGLSGYSRGRIACCHADGVVSGDTCVGGLVGYQFVASIAMSHSSATVDGGSEVGGLVGWNYLASISTSYNIGVVVGNEDVGGLVGQNEGRSTVTSCFWDVETSGRTNMCGAQDLESVGCTDECGKTTSQMQNIQTYLDAGWVFSDGLADETANLFQWQMPEGGGYPTLAIFRGYSPPQLQGSGTSKNPYLICNAAELGAMIYYSPHAHYRLAAAIDLSGIRWPDAVIPWFAGVFDGGGVSISGLTIHGGARLGLFGKLEYDAEVKNLAVLDVNISGSGIFVGGLVGDNWGNVTACCSTGEVKGGQYVGGLVGSSAGEVNRCYSLAAAVGDSVVGGLIGENGQLMDYGFEGTIAECYSAGPVSGNEFVGGLAGKSKNDWWPPVTSSFWDTQASGQISSDGGEGRTTAEMQDPNTFVAAGWNFVGQADGPLDIWAEPEGGGYPILYWQLPPGFGLPTFSGGTGEPDDPYLIYTAQELNSIGHNPRLINCHFKLVKNLDLTGIQFHPIGAPDFPYKGVFDGNGYTVSHLTITGGSYLGLFGLLASGGMVRDLGVSDVNITGWDYVGGLVGGNGNWQIEGGMIVNCYSTGLVGGGSDVGGLVGFNSGSITTSYSSASVTGRDCGGGLVGGNTYGSIANCYSSGVVNGRGRGLVVSDWYGVVTSSFWDIQTSGQTTSYGGTGKTTAEMQTAKTFLEAGWDFVGETANGTEDIWKIAEGLDYPRLWWEPHDGRVTVALGQAFTVTLESNPSTGYRWEWVDHQDSIVEQMGEAQFKPRETGDPPLVGAGGWESFDFKAVNQGQMTLKLVYRRPWEEGVEPLKTFSLQVTVP